MGAIVESGRHGDLLRKGGRYATFFHLQFPDNQEELPALVDDRVLAPALT